MYYAWYDRTRHAIKPGRGYPPERAYQYAKVYGAKPEFLKFVDVSPYSEKKVERLGISYIISCGLKRISSTELFLLGKHNYHSFSIELFDHISSMLNRALVIRNTEPAIRKEIVEIDFEKEEELYQKEVKLTAMGDGKMLPRQYPRFRKQWWNIR